MGETFENFSTCLPTFFFQLLLTVEKENNTILTTKKLKIVLFGRVENLIFHKTYFMGHLVLFLKIIIKNNF